MVMPVIFVAYLQIQSASKTTSVQSAIPLLEAAHSFQRLEVNNNYELANCYARTSQRDKALYAYKEALRANAGYDEILFQYGNGNGAGRRLEGRY
jgi:tetratricopeptide (TPR) repeat protein